MDLIFRPVLLSCVIVCLAWLTGCGGAGNAKISSMMPTGFATGRFSCWLTIDFKKIPPGINKRDVKVVFSSTCMPNPLTFDWSSIAAKAQVKKAKGKGREKATEVSPDSDPPLNYPFDVKFPLEAKQALMESETDFILNAELYWGGELQDSDYASIRHFYKRR